MHAGKRRGPDGGCSPPAAPVYTLAVDCVERLCVLVCVDDPCARPTRDGLAREKGKNGNLTSRSTQRRRHRTPEKAEARTTVKAEGRTTVKRYIYYNRVRMNIPSPSPAVLRTEGGRREYSYQLVGIYMWPPRPRARRARATRRRRLQRYEAEADFGHRGFLLESVQNHTKTNY